MDAREKEGGNSNPSFTVLKVLSCSVSTRRSLRILSSVVPLIGRVYRGTHFFIHTCGLDKSFKRRKKTKHEDKVIYFPVDFWRKLKRRLSFKHADVLEWKKKDALKYEFDVLGMYLTGHPLDAYTDVEGHKGVISIAELHATEYYKDVVIAGIITSWRVMFSESGHRLAFITVQDRTGQFDISFFRDDVDTYDVYFRASDPVYIEGLWSRGGKTVDGKPKGKIKVKGMQELSEYREKYAKRIEIKTKLAEVSQDRLKQLNFLFQEVISPVYSHNIEEIHEIEENIEKNREAKEMATEEADQSATAESNTEENRENKNKENKNKEDSTPNTNSGELVLLVE